MGFEQPRQCLAKAIDTPLTVAEENSATEKEKRHVFNLLIERRHGESINSVPDKRDDQEEPFKEYEDDKETTRAVDNIEDAVDATGKLINQKSRI